MNDARPADPIDIIEFHDATIERVERRSATEVAIVFDHLYVCIRSKSDHAGWSYRAELVLSGVSRFEQLGDVPDPSKRSETEMHYVPDGEVRDANGEEIDPIVLLDGAPAATFAMSYCTSELVELSADVTYARLTLRAAIERIEDCYVARG